MAGEAGDNGRDHDGPPAAPRPGDHGRQDAEGRRDRRGTTIVEERIAPVVMLTAFSQRELIEQARDAGAMAYLVKPFARHELVPAIELAVSRFAERRALEDEVATLTDRLETRKIVDRAKGLLMTRQEMTEPEAFHVDPAHGDEPPDDDQAVAQAVVDGLAEPR